MNDNKYTIMNGTMIGLGGFILLCSVDWRIAVGVTLLIWGDNLSKTPRFTKKENADGNS